MRLSSAGASRVELQRAAPDGLAAQGDEEHAARRPSSASRREARRGIEAGLEPPVELGVVLPQAVLGSGAGRIDDDDLHQRRRQQPLDLGHRGDEPLALRLAQRLEQRPRELVAAPVEHLPLGEPGRREPGGADPPVGRARARPLTSPRRLERAQQAAEVAGVDAEPRAQHADVAAVLADLPQHARLAERAVPGEEAIVERADPLRDEAVEAPHLGDGLVVHSLILVREQCQCEGTTTVTAALAALVTPATSVWVAVIVWVPAASFTVSVHLPFEATVAVPTAVEPS